MKNVLKNAITALSSVRLTPLIVLMLLCSNRHIVWADLDRGWGYFRFGRQPRNLMERILLFVNLMTWEPQYRNVFYLRTGMPGRLLSILCLCRPMYSLGLGDTKIGPGLLIWHGDGTFVSADEIGKNCTIWHQVTIGYVELGTPDDHREQRHGLRWSQGSRQGEGRRQCDNWRQFRCDKRCPSQRHSDGGSRCCRLECRTAATEEQIRSRQQSRAIT